MKFLPVSGDAPGLSPELTSLLREQTMPPMKTPLPATRRLQDTGISRREFLATSTAVAALTIAPRHVLGGAGQVAPSEKITMAGIGMGSQGTQNMAAFLPFPQIQFVAVCDVNRESGGYLSWYWGEGK